MLEIYTMPSAESAPRTLYDKVLSDHIVNEQDDGTLLIYIGMVIDGDVKGICR